ncbi:uncharacterized protein LOC135931948 [Gordionus sp. m RMFG-2023]|uniref:uncharacterized protein LOC135931948 n=1 Tax=Gordionus sp. m RMFG-2023 TaxID=3053472 RepID=UPI0031FCFD17
MGKPKADNRKCQTFINKCLNIINGVFYPRLITNKTLWRQSKHTPFHIILKKKRIQFLAHILKHPNSNLVHDALTWLFTCRGKSYSRYKTLWFHRVLKDVADLNINWKQFVRLNNNKNSIKKFLYLKIKSRYLR